MLINRLKIIIRKSLLILGVLFFLGHCSLIESPQINSLNEVDFLGLENGILQLLINVDINNPNGISANVNRIDSKIYIDDNYVGTGTSRELLKIKANGVTKMNFYSNLNLDSFSKLFPQIIRKNKPSTLKVDGTYYVNAGVANVKVKTEVQTQIELGQEIKKLIQKAVQSDGIHLTRLKPKQVSINKSTAILEVRLKNNFPFDYQLKQIKLKLFFEGEETEFGDWVLKQPIKMEAETEELIEGEIKIRNFSTLSQLGAVFFNRKKILRIKGIATLTIAGRLFDIPIEQELPIEKLLF